MLIVRAAAGRNRLGSDLEEQWTNEREYTTKVVRGAKAEVAFPEFFARKGRPASI
jgi:hypothetical protein